MLEHPNIRETLNQALVDDKVRRVLDYCAKNQVRFVDQQFPPNQASLAGNPPHPEYRGQFNSLKWAKAEDIFGKGNYEVFRGIEPNDIRQGSLGDCYFLCSLAALAEQPSLIRRLFDIQTINQYGVLGVWLHINGAWQLYALDEYFPVNGANGTLAFSKSLGNELWVIAIEKAYAKAYGSYFGIVGGDPVHALRDLTGAPYDRIEDYTDLKAAWAKLKDANSKGYILTCFTKSAAIAEQQSGEGLVSGHAYSILDCREVIDAYGAPRFIVQLRNPWGKFEWNGEFSDDSKSWIENTKRELKVVKSDDGVFWMPFEEFVKHFEGIGILKTVPGYVSNGINVKRNNSLNKHLVRLTVPQGVDVSISVDQHDSRTYEDPNYQYSYIRLTIAKVLSNGLELVDMVLSPERSIFIEKRLEAGDYVVLVEVYWTNNVATGVSVGIYGSNHVELQTVEMDDSLYSSTEYQIWKSFAFKNKHLFQKVDSRQATDGYAKSQLDTYKFQNKKGGFTLYNYQNEGQQYGVHDSMRFLKLQGFDVLGRQADQSGAEVLMNPMDNDILMFKMDPRKEAFSMSLQIHSEELVAGTLSANTQGLEFAQKIGGSQPSPKDNDPAIQSREQQRRELERLAKEKAQEEEQRRKLLLQQQQLAAEKKRKQEEYLRQQGELYNRINQGRKDRVQDRSGLGDMIGTFFGGFFGKDPNQQQYGYDQQSQFQYANQQPQYQQQQYQQQYQQQQQQQYGYNQNSQWSQPAPSNQNCAIF